MDIVAYVDIASVEIPADALVRAGAIGIDVVVPNIVCVNRLDGLALAVVVHTINSIPERLIIVKYTSDTRRRGLT